METYSRVSKAEMRDEMARKYFQMRSLDFKIHDLQLKFKFSVTPTAQQYFDLAMTIKAKRL